MGFVDHISARLHSLRLEPGFACAVRGDADDEHGPLAAENDIDEEPGMNTPSHSRKDTGFDARRYRFAARAALGVSATMLAGSAQAAIQHSGAINLVSTGDITPTTGLLVGFSVTATSSTGSLAPNNLGFGFGATYGQWFRSTAAVADVGPAWNFAQGAGFKFMDGSTFPLTNNALGNSDDNLVGFSFQDPGINGGAVTYGWARIDIPNTGGSQAAAAAVRITEWAYDDAGASIALGQTAAVAVPEPTTLPMLALGAAGVLAHRRRKRLQVESEQAS